MKKLKVYLGKEYVEFDFESTEVQSLALPSGRTARGKKIWGGFRVRSAQQYPYYKSTDFTDKEIQDKNYIVTLKKDKYIN